MRLVHSNRIPETSVSHDPGLKKKVILEKGYIPSLMMLSEAGLKPGESFSSHKHDTMYEVFYIKSGKVVFVVNKDEVVVENGDCICIEPRETHYQKNPFAKPARWLYFGISID